MNTHARSPLPNALPGRFCLLTYSRLTEQYTLYVDDAARASYNLSSDSAQVQRYFALWKQRRGDDLIDTAREFGAAQLVFADQRVIPIYSKAAPPFRIEYPGTPKTGRLIPPRRATAR